MLKLLFGGIAIAYGVENYQQKRAECVNFSDKHLEKCLGQIENGIKELQQKYQGLQRPDISHGFGGGRYSIEFPITGKNIDAFSILASTLKLILKSRESNGAHVITINSSLQNDSVSYLLDYKVDSTTALGTKNKGSIFIRGIKSSDGGDD
jgi:hypothetical protein